MSTLLGPEGTGVLTQVNFRRTPAGRKVWHERCVATTRVTLNQLNRSHLCVGVGGGVGWDRP